MFNILFLEPNKKKKQNCEYIMGWAGKDSFRSFFVVTFNFIS